MKIKIHKACLLNHFLIIGYLIFAIYKCLFFMLFKLPLKFVFDIPSRHTLAPGDLRILISEGVSIINLFDVNVKMFDQSVRKKLKLFV